MMSACARQVGLATWKTLVRLGHSLGAPNRAHLRSIVLLEPDIAQSCEFFRQGLGGRVAVATEGWAEIEVGGAARGGQGKAEGDAPAHPSSPILIHLKKRPIKDGDAERTQHIKPNASTATHAADERTTAASPTSSESTTPTSMLVFDVEDVQACLVNMLQHGGHMDGRIEYSPDGTTHAVVQSPGGTSVGLVGGSSVRPS